eukprot:TRINITY_DN93593_c0_g1_i1.p2 TRINITY_DN93593_c0_g1~~TRINITY_DN93593_c0_g1_i1.p2  ORF type:complete len:218 (-),score=40.31 TRINITY_DN93593_c0_g1_i1:25-648(-)
MFCPYKQVTVGLLCHGLLAASAQMEVGITAGGALEGVSSGSDGSGDAKSTRSELSAGEADNWDSSAGAGSLLEDAAQQPEPISPERKCTGTMLSCSNPSVGDPCSKSSCVNAFHNCEELGPGVWKQCQPVNGGAECKARDICYLQCRGKLLTGTACGQRIVKTGADCNNGWVNTGTGGMRCTVDPEDASRCIEKEPCAPPPQGGGSL